MNKGLTMSIFGYLTAALLLFSVTSVHAQVNGGSQNSDPNSQGQLNNGSSANTVPGTNAGNSTTGTLKFNPLWLIPIIGIPLLIAALASNSTKDESQNISNYGYQGTKGGRSEKKKKRRVEEKTDETDTTL